MIIVNLDKLRFNKLLLLYDRAGNDLKHARETHNQPLIQKLQQHCYAIEDLEFDLTLAQIEKVQQVQDDVQQNKKINLNPIQGPYKTIDAKIITQLRLYYWHALVQQRAYMDDLQGYDATFCRNPNYESYLEMIRKIFDVWQIKAPDNYADLDQLIKVVHYTKTIDPNGSTHYLQINTNGQIVRHPIKPNNIK